MDYDDIIDLQRPEPKTMPRMSMEKRAAQFFSFDPIPGFEGSVDSISEMIEKEADRIEQIETISVKKESK